jgi:hypothetical protein
VSGVTPPVSKYVCARDRDHEIDLRQFVGA